MTETAISAATLVAGGAARSARRRSKALYRLRRDRAALFGLACLLVFVLLGALGPALAPHDPNVISLGKALAPPGADALLGRDQLGRDLLSRVMHGARTSLIIGVITVLIASGVGVPLGLIAGYMGGWVDSLIVSILDVLLAFPTILLALILIAILGPDLQNTMIAVGVTSMPAFAKLARASTMSVKQNEYVTAAVCLGQRTGGILRRHVFPNVLAPLIVQATMRMGTAILTASTLSFLGLGVRPPTPEWGALVAEGRAFLRAAPHVSVFPGLTIMLCILGFSLFGDGLNDALNPKLGRE